MKINLKNNCSLKTIALLLAVCMTVSLSSCVPDPSGPNMNGNEQVEAKPDPENTKQIGLFSDSGDNIAGLGFSKDGYLKSIVNNMPEWYLAPVGEVPGIGNIDYIPLRNWDTFLVPRLGLGFVGYSATEGFVRFYVAGLAYDSNSNNSVVGVGLKYVGGFSGSEEALEFAETSFEVNSGGGKVETALTGKKYATYQFYTNANWLTIIRTSSVYSFIYDVLEIEVAPNSSAEERTATISVVSGDNKETVITIYQKGNPSAAE